MTGPAAVATMLVVRMLTTHPVVPPLGPAITVGPSILGGEALAIHLESEVAALLEVLPSRSSERLEIAVGGELLDFEVRLGIGVDATVTRCACTHPELVTHVLRRVAASRVSHADAPPPPPPSPPPPPPPPPPPRIVTRTEVQLVGPGPLARGGVASLVIGGALLGGGTGLLLGHEAETDLVIGPVDWRPLGVSALIGGGTAIVVGTVLLGLERRRRRMGSPR